MDITKLPRIQIKYNMAYEPKKQIPDDPILKMLVPDDKLNQDTVFISEEAKELQSYLTSEMIQNFREGLEKTENPLDDEIKCMQIAMRIMAGDRVPSKDEKFLAEKQPELYLRAILLRKQKEDAKEYDSVLEDEEENVDSVDSPSISSEGSTGQSAPTPDVEVSVEVAE